MGEFFIAKKMSGSVRLFLCLEFRVFENQPRQSLLGEKSSMSELLMNGRICTMVAVCMYFEILIKSKNLPDLKYFRIKQMELLLPKSFQKIRYAVIFYKNIQINLFY